MNQAIYKYPLKNSEGQNIQMPKGAQILTIQNKNEIPCIWALVDIDTKETETRFIETYGTGHTIVNDLGTERKYIGTVLLGSGALVFHVFEYTGV